MPFVFLFVAFLDNKPFSPSEFAHLSENLPAVTQVARHSLKTWQKFDCDTCDRTFNGQFEWNKHVNGRRHKKKARGVTRRAELEAKRSVVRAERKRKRAEKSTLESAGDGLEKKGNDVCTDLFGK